MRKGRGSHTAEGRGFRPCGGHRAVQDWAPIHLPPCSLCGGAAGPAQRSPSYCSESGGAIVQGTSSGLGAPAPSDSGSVYALESPCRCPVFKKPHGILAESLLPCNSTCSFLPTRVHQRAAGARPGGPGARGGPLGVPWGEAELGQTTQPRSGLLGLLC